MLRKTAYWLNRRLARYSSGGAPAEGLSPPPDSQKLLEIMRPGDVLLVEGHSRIPSCRARRN